MAYYKTSDPKALAAWKAYTDAAEIIQQKGEEFAKIFPGAKPLFTTSIHSGRRFYGLTFRPAMPQPLWTKPDPKTGNSQRPRNALPAGIKGEERKRLSVELQALRELYSSNEPEDRGDLEPFLNSIGLSSGALFFSGYRQVITDGTIYVETSAKPDGILVEILGSEFEAANK